MRKFLILLIAIPFLAASCDFTTGVFDFGSGVRGVFKSEDNGESFASANDLQKGKINNLSITDLAFDTSNRDVLYAGSSSGVHKSENAAKTWRYILAGISVSSIATDQFAPQTIYASGISGQNGKIIKTVDGGTSWVDIYSEPSKNNTVLSIALSKTSSSLVLAGLNNGEIIRSVDSGRTWQTAKDLADKVLDIEFGPSEQIYALTSRNGLHESLDKGVTWKQITNTLTSETLNPAGQTISSVSTFYDLAIDQKQAGVVYLGTEQGLFRTVNDGANWSFISLPVKNAALRVSSVAVHPSNSNILMVSIASTLYKSINGGLTWETKVLPTSAKIHNIMINQDSTNIIYLGMSQ